MRFRKTLADPQESCGSEIPREITASRVRRTVWWPRGVVKQTFLTEIRPELNIVLEHTGLGYADIFLSLFMIGSRQSTAVPTIMLSCLSESVRNDAIKAIKDSNVLRDHPEFSFGASALPLNEPIPSQYLGHPENQASAILQLPRTPKDNQAHDISPSIKTHMLMKQGDLTVMAIDTQPSIGRRLFLADSNGKPLRGATGGAVLQIGDLYYQRTIGHIDEKSHDTSLFSQPQDLDYCYLEEDADSEDEDAGYPADHEVTSRGSMSPSTEIISFVGSSDAESLYDTVMTDAPTLDTGLAEASSVTQDEHWLPASEINESNEYFIPGSQKGSALVNVGQLQHHSRDGLNTFLDYSLAMLDPLLEGQLVNEIEINHGKSKAPLRVCTVATIKDTERDIIVVTASNGTTRGKLIPSAVCIKDRTQQSLEELFVVQLQGHIMNGDCGADVVDAQTGDLYGHIVRGCPGTEIAYIRAATDVFEDIRQRLGIIPVLPSNILGKSGAEQSKSADSQITSVPHGRGTQTPQIDTSSSDHFSNSHGSVLLACPFAKKDPITHEHCNRYEFKEIRHVKQHLKRCHLVVPCPHCRNGFNSQETLEQHLVGGCKPRNVRAPEGMTTSQHEMLKPRSNPRLSIAEQWYFIWDILFPGVHRPTKPCKDEFLDSVELFKALEEFEANHMSGLVSEFMSETGEYSPTFHKQATRIIQRSVHAFADCVRRSAGIGGPGENSRAHLLRTWSENVVENDWDKLDTGSNADSAYDSIDSPHGDSTLSRRSSRSTIVDDQAVQDARSEFDRTLRFEDYFAATSWTPDQ